MSSAAEVLAGIAGRRIEAIKGKVMTPGADAGHSNFHIREMATSPQARASELVIKGVGKKWQEALVESGLSYEVILCRDPLGHLDGYPSSREHHRDSAEVYCPDADLSRVIAAADKVSKENDQGVIVIQDSWPMYVPVQGEMVPLGYHMVKMYTLWQYPDRKG